MFEPVFLAERSMSSLKDKFILLWEIKGDRQTYYGLGGVNGGVVNFLKEVSAGGDGTNLDRDP